MTDEHKQALAAGRAEGRVVKDYLEALRNNRPKPGRRRTAESISKRLAAIADELLAADALNELKLVQEQMNLEHELATMDEGVDISALEEAFVAVAKGYSERQGISYAAWRRVGVEASVLKDADISRGS
jgi:hypothetical protein